MYSASRPGAIVAEMFSLSLEAFSVPLSIVLGTSLLLLCFAFIKGRTTSRKFTVVNELYVDHFPPSRRHMLPRVLGTRSTEIHPTMLQKKALPSTRMVDLDRVNMYTPTGFTTREIKSLGHFPDYALLSGVRPPQPCSPDFDISKAVFRPFRPFRWKYHQNMCEKLPPYP